MRSADKRDYLRGGSLGELMERHPRAVKTMSREESGGSEPEKSFKRGAKSCHAESASHLSIIFIHLLGKSLFQLLSNT